MFKILVAMLITFFMFENKYWNSKGFLNRNNIIYELLKRIILWHYFLLCGLQQCTETFNLAIGTDVHFNI
jgi:hypothetical protein